MACMHSLSSSGMVHQGWRSVAESGHVANRMGGVGGVLVYMTQYGLDRLVGRWYR